MIELNKITEQSFLNRENIYKLLKAGIDFDDAVYGILKLEQVDYIVFLEEYPEALPTYSLTELFYKSWEHGGIKVDGIQTQGWYMFKDAPFYGMGYKTVDEDGEIHHPDSLMTYADYPIDAMCNFLVMCKNNGIGYIKNVKSKTLKL